MMATTTEPSSTGAWVPASDFALVAPTVELLPVVEPLPEVELLPEVEPLVLGEFEVDADVFVSPLMYDAKFGHVILVSA
jgi:hypothetical protein